MVKKKLSKSTPAATSAKGFTLLEALIATTILGIAILGLVGVLTLGMRIVDRNKIENQKVFTAQGKMETELSKPFDQVQGVEFLPGLKEVNIDGILKTYIVDR